MKTIYLIILSLSILLGCKINIHNQILFNGLDTSEVIVELKNCTYDLKSYEYIINASNATITFSPKIGFWDMSKYVFIECEVENLSGKNQLVELLLNNDPWAMGGVYFNPGEKKVVRAIIMRQNFTSEQLSQFPNMNGLPGGSVKLWWKSYVPDSISSITLSLPLSISGDQIKVGNISMSENFKTFTPEEYQKFLPIIDEFGQYIHKEWPGKIKNKNDLLNADKNEVADLEAHPGHAEMSTFGGWKKGPQLETTGHFRVEKYNEKWSIIDPEGYLFWSHGIDCVRLGSETPVEGREQLFSFLPERSGEFSDFFSTGKVSSSYTPYSAGKVNSSTVEFVDFYGMNLKRKWGNDFNARFVDRTVKRLRSWEMNTIANWSSPNVYEQHQIPYTINVNTAKNRMLPDPFNPSFENLIEDQLKKVHANALNDPWCIGIFVDNEIHWGNVSYLGSIVLSTNKYPFAKEVLIDYLRKKYNSTISMNQAWGSEFKSWNELIDNTDLFPGAYEDINAMSVIFAEKYFSNCKDAIKRVAPQILYLGCRFDFHFYPKQDKLGRDWVISYAAKYADIVSFNRYNYSANTMKPHAHMDFPIIIGEFHTGALDRGLPHSGLRLTNNQKERALVYKNFLSQAVKNPYILGVGWFQYLDQPYTGRNDGENYQIDFITVGDYPNQEIVESAREFGLNMYNERYGKIINN